MGLKERWLLEAKKRQAEKNEDDYYRPQVGVYHASKLNPHGCLRRKVAVFLKALEHGRPYSDYTLSVFELGNIIHREIQSLYPKENTEVPFEIAILDFKIVGKVDILDGSRVIELKTWGSHKRKDGDWFLIELPERPEAQHRRQAEIYMRGTHRHKATIVYIRKTDMAMREFTVQRDDKLWHDIIAYTSRLHWFVSRGELPPVDCGKCQYCEVKNGEEKGR